jgi:hypothetical protein
LSYAKMDLRRYTGVQFVSKAPTRAGGEIALRVTSLEPSHVLWWHSHIQPIIDSEPKRVDMGWNWMLYAPLTRLFGVATAKRPVGYTVGIAAHDSGHFIPCALLLLLGRDRALDNHKKRSTFTWYLTTAPDAALLNIDDYDLQPEQLPKRLGSIALDVAVTHSLNHIARGRVSLHADVSGGERLLGWYQKRGMTALPEGQRLPRGPRRLVKPSDGHYCYYTLKAALAASRELDSLR